MAKRKHGDKKGMKREEESSSDESDNLLDVEFEFFDPQPEHDFHGLKTLLRQLLDADAQSVDLSALADLILAQPLLGSTVKVDGNGSDPYAFLTVLNLKQAKDNAVIRTIRNYLEERSGKQPSMADVYAHLRPESTAEVGLILTDRLLNLPSELVPPMYKMLLDEVTWAVEEKEPYRFSHYLILSKTYTEIESVLDHEDDRPKKKKKHAQSSSSKDVFYFHAEDEVFHKHAVAFGSFPYSNESSNSDADSKRAFQEMGIKPQGHLILIEAAKFEGAVAAVEQYLRVS